MIHYKYIKVVTPMKTDRSLCGLLWFNSGLSVVRLLPYLIALFIKLYEIISGTKKCIKEAGNELTITKLHYRPF